jgi:drug/metabolite transporter (DMT)-like permease
MRGNRLIGVGLVALGAVLWGGWAAVVRPSGLAPVQMTFVSMVVMALPLPFVLRGVTFRDRGAVVALVVLGIADAGSTGLLFTALARGPVAVAELTHYLAPILVTMAGPLLLGEPGSRRAWLAAPVSFLGLGLLIWRPGGGDALVTALIGATSALFYATYILAARRAGRTFPARALVPLHAVLSSAVLLLLFGGAVIPPTGSGTLHAVVGAAICGGLGSWVFFKGVNLIPAAVTGALAYLEPLTAALVAWVLFGERIDPLGMVGVALVLASGVAMATERERAAAH